MFVAGSSTLNKNIYLNRMNVKSLGRIFHSFEIFTSAIDQNFRQ